MSDVLGKAVAMLMLMLGAGFAMGCEAPPPDATPEGAVRTLIERMRQLHGSGADAQAAFALLSAGTQKQLRERAERASAVSGAQLAPEDMLASSHFWLRFEPEQFAARQQGDHAWVTVTDGGQPGAKTREISCVREAGAWRVELELPELPPLRKRPSAEP